MAVQGNLEVTIKINELPAIALTDRNGWIIFNIACGDRVIGLATVGNSLQASICLLKIYSFS